MVIWYSSVVVCLFRYGSMHGSTIRYGSVALRYGSISGSMINGSTVDGSMALRYGSMYGRVSGSMVYGSTVYGSMVRTPKPSTSCSMTPSIAA